jgi:hypothetical protein
VNSENGTGCWPFVPRALRQCLWRAVAATELVGMSANMSLAAVDALLSVGA